MSYQSNDEPMPPGFTSLQTYRLMLPTEVALRLKSDAAGAAAVWKAIQAHQSADSDLIFDETHASKDSRREGTEVAADANDDTPSKDVVMALKATQTQRLEDLIATFGKSSSKLTYLAGQIQADPDAPASTLHLNKDALGASIIRAPSEAHKPLFGSGWSGSQRKQQDAHNVLDIFAVACRKIPGFRAASARSKHRVNPRPIAAEPPPPIPYNGKEPPLRFDPPLMGESEITPSRLKGCLTLGETGAGKTASFVEPVLHAMLSYRIEDKAASILVIDPKVELLDSVKKMLAELGELERLVVVGQTGPIIYFDERHDLSLEDRFAKANGFVSTNDRDDTGRWQLMAERFVMSFMADAQAFFDITGAGLLQSIVCIATRDTAHLRSGQWSALRKMLNLGMESGNQLRLISDIYDVLCFGVGLSKVERPYSRYINLKDSDQIFYNSRGALLIADLLGSDDIEPFLDMSLTRSKGAVQGCNIAELIEHGAVIVFQPRKKATHDLVGKALKSAFFRAAFERKDMQRPMGYFCDEAQRFLTTDEETGEHSVFDTARAYRLTACIATQSMAALQTAVGAGPRAITALDSIVVNTPTKACFRTTDVASLQLMKRFIPPDPRGLGHVLNARPPSSLKVGECYFSLGHEWGRSRYRLTEPQVGDWNPPDAAKQGEPQ